jgi:hypothetical protein
MGEAGRASDFSDEKVNATSRNKGYNSFKIDSFGRLFINFSKIIFMACTVCISAVSA